MKKLYFIALFLLAVLISNAQNCYWIKGATPGGSSGMGGESGAGIATDSAGNVYVTGNFDAATMKFGTTTLTNAYIGSSEAGIFLAKYTPSGNLIWVKGTDHAQSLGVAIDARSNAYITGAYSQSVTFGTTTLTCAGGGLFLAKYDASGNIKWARAAGGSLSGSSDWATSVTTDKSGNVIICGQFYCPTLTIDTYTFTNANPGSPDYFIAKYDSLGNVLWAGNAGGNRNDFGTSLSTDGLNNIYVAGSFASDSIKFGNTTLYSQMAGASFPFLTKYDPNGNIIWSKKLLNGAAFFPLKVLVYGGNELLITGSTGGETIFGNDTVNKGNPGYFAAFVAKFDSSGNAIWGKGSTTPPNRDEYGNAVTFDSAGNIYFTGSFLGASMTFGSSVLSNPFTSTQPFLFVAKFDPNGIAQWGKTANGPTATIWSKGIAAGLGENIYFTGSFSGTSINLDASFYTGIQYSDYFVADAYTFNTAISFSSPASCNGSSDGMAVAVASGGNLPYSFSWNTTPVQNNDTAFNLPAGGYQVAITEGYGCTQYSTVTITEPAPDSLHLCMVTVDSASQYNILTWDKTSFTDIDSFIVYREISTNNYQPIASIPYDSLSMFVDTVRTLYFPNTGDPNAGTYRYKLRGHLVCGGSTGLSPFHNTIYFLNNSGTFYWVQPYTIQGSPNPVSSYILLRDNNSNGNWQAVASVAGTQQLVSDPLYTVYQNTATWRVQTQWSISCTPTAKQNGVNSAFSSSYSNTYTNIGIGIKNNVESLVLVYPSPNTGSFTIETGSLKNVRVEMFDLLGNQVYKADLKKEKNSIETQGLSKGSYFIHLISDKGGIVRKIIIQ